MDFQPGKHGVTAKTDFVRGTVQAKRGKALTEEQIAALTPEGVNTAVAHGVAFLTEDGRQVFPPPPATTEEPAKPAKPRKPAKSSKAATPKKPPPPPPPPPPALEPSGGDGGAGE